MRIKPDKAGTGYYAYTANHAPEAGLDTVVFVHGAAMDHSVWSHYRMSDRDLRAAGINQGTIRLSVGLEDSDDLLEDLSRGIYRSKKATK